MFLFYVFAEHWPMYLSVWYVMSGIFFKFHPPNLKDDLARRHSKRKKKKKFFLFLNRAINKHNLTVDIAKIKKINILGS